MFKKVISLVLALCLMLLSVPAFAAEAPEEDTEAPEDAPIVFPDVPEGEWYYPYVYQAVAANMMRGDNEGNFLPDKEVTYAEFIAMLVNTFYPQLKRPDTGMDWYVPYVDAFRESNLLMHVEKSGADPKDFPAKEPISRYDMARLLYNVIDDMGWYVPSSFFDNQLPADYDEIPEAGNTRYSARVMFTTGIISGKDSDAAGPYSSARFAGADTMTRAEAATVLCKTVDRYWLNEAGISVTPDLFTMKPDSSVSSEGGVFQFRNPASGGKGVFITFMNPGYSTLDFTVSFLADAPAAEGAESAGYSHVISVTGSNDGAVFEEIWKQTCTESPADISVDVSQYHVLRIVCELPAGADISSALLHS